VLLVVFNQLGYLLDQLVLGQGLLLLLGLGLGLGHIDLLGLLLGYTSHWLVQA
jgi:hypothetical protein